MSIISNIPKQNFFFPLAYEFFLTLLDFPNVMKKTVFLKMSQLYFLKVFTQIKEQGSHWSSSQNSPALAEQTCASFSPRAPTELVSQDLRCPQCVVAGGEAPEGTLSDAE